MARPEWPGLLAAAALAGVVLAPIASLAIVAAQGSGELWPHLLAYVLPQAIRDTTLLLLGTGLLVVVLGTGSAWLVASYDFPGRRLLETALLLPLAIPTYIAAYAYLDLLHPLGPVQSTLRALLGAARPRDLVLPDLRSLPGCVLVLGLVLYPYVYLPVRALFLMQAAGFAEAARTLGAGPGRVFRRIALPLARPAIALGASLALMEAVNDVGAAEFLGVRTLTVQVYATWINRSDLPGAAQIALVMLVAVLGLVALERRARGARGYAAGAQRGRVPVRTALTGHRAATALGLGLLPVILGFALPAGYLAQAAVTRAARSGLPPTLMAEAGNTLLLAALATLVVTALALPVAAAPQLLRSRLGGALPRLAGVGYALPGTVLAIGLLAPLAALDRGAAAVAAPLLGPLPALIGVGTSAALVLAYAIRFLAVAVGAAEAGLSLIPRSLPDAARVLGRGRLATLREVQGPLARPALVSGALLVFVDTVKELPATLLLRPLNVETLATHVYGEAARGTYEDGAAAALLIVVVGLLPVGLLLRIGVPDLARRAGDRALRAGAA